MLGVGGPSAGRSAIAAVPSRPWSPPRQAPATPATPLPRARTPASRVTSERPALERITTERAALQPHPRWHRLLRRIGQPRALGLVALRAVVLGIAAIFGSERLLQNDEQPGQHRRSPGAIVPGESRSRCSTGPRSRGWRAKVGDDVQVNGFKLGTISNSRKRFDQTVVMYEPGRAAGRQAGRARPRGEDRCRRSTVRPSEEAGSADVVVIAGADRAQPVSRLGARPVRRAAGRHRGHRRRSWSTPGRPDLELQVTASHAQDLAAGGRRVPGGPHPLLRPRERPARHGRRSSGRTLKLRPHPVPGPVGGRQGGRLHLERTKRVGRRPQSRPSLPAPGAAARPRSRHGLPAADRHRRAARRVNASALQLLGILIACGAAAVRPPGARSAAPICGRGGRADRRARRWSPGTSGIRADSSTSVTTPAKLAAAVASPWWSCAVVAAIFRRWPWAFPLATVRRPAAAGAGAGRRARPSHLLYRCTW